VYLPRHFEAPEGELARFLSSAQAADLITRAAAGLVASTLPLLFDADSQPKGTFYGHLARANPQWSDLVSDEALVLVRGPEAYVSPSYYPSKAEHGQVVPTWNYISVQARGRLIVHDDPAWTEALVRRLTEHHEGARSNPWSVDDAPQEYVHAQLHAIVGIEVQIEELSGKWKLSQNRPAADIVGVISGLQHGTPREAEVAEVMTQPRDGSPQPPSNG
jgi:transcriptional regulator